MASELESDLWDTVDWGKMCLFYFNAGKNSAVFFDWSNNTGAIDVKMDRSVLLEKSSFKINQYLHHNLGYKKYKLFDVTKFILVLPMFWLMQQSLSGTRCWVKGLHSVLKLLLNGI